VNPLLLDSARLLLLQPDTPTPSGAANKPETERRQFAQTQQRIFKKNFEAIFTIRERIEILYFDFDSLLSYTKVESQKRSMQS
jgi:hypothetical protein